MASLRGRERGREGGSGREEGNEPRERGRERKGGREEGESWVDGKSKMRSRLEVEGDGE